MADSKIRIQLTNTKPERVTIPAGTRFQSGTSVTYRSKRKATFGFWRRLWWRLMCLVRREELPQTLRIPVERIG